MGVQHVTDDRERFERFKRFEEWEARQSASTVEERTVGALYAEWLETLAPLARKNRTTQGRHLHRPFRCRGEEMKLGDLTPSQLTPVVLQAWLAMLGATRSTQSDRTLSLGTVDQIRMGVQSCFKYFVALGELERNPWHKVKRNPLRDRRRQGYYTPEELERFAAALPQIGAWILRHCYRTCCRRDSIRLLRKHQIDWESRELVLTVKGGKQARVPVPDVTLEEMRALCAVAPGEFVYPNPLRPYEPVPEATLQKWMKRARKATGLVLPGGESPNIHHARHAGALALLDAGADITDVQVQLTHSEIKTTARYLAMRDRRRVRLRDLLNKIR
jgi:integrase